VKIGNLDATLARLGCYACMALSQTDGANALSHWGNWGMTSHRKSPRDPNQLAKMLVDIVAGEIEDREPPSTKAPAAFPAARRRSSARSRSPKARAARAASARCAGAEG